VSPPCSGSSVAASADAATAQPVDIRVEGRAGLQTLDAIVRLLPRGPREVVMPVDDGGARQHIAHVEHCHGPTLGWDGE
jgi:hypothetical protein